MKICLTATPDIPKIMRTCLVQAMIILTLCGVATAHTNFAQLLERKVTLAASDVPLKNVLAAIEEQTSVKFFYSQEHVDVTTLVSLHVEKTSLNIVFAELFPPLSIRYKVHEKSGTVTLRHEKNMTGKTDEPPSRNIPADKRALISGTVTDAQSATAMPGVNIIIKGTASGTTTNADGAYTINAESDDILVFTFIGYSPVETTVGSRTQIDIQMAEDIQSLKEVVINAGYYTTTKEQQTGNIARIEATDIGKQSVSNPLAAMQGRMAGVEIIQRNGVPGGNFQVRIRGNNSLANGNDPLYIIDGVPYTSTSMSFNETSGSILGNSNPKAGLGSSPLNSINPADIASIEVLKDADATAIYGSRGANGVILITTKGGKPGKTSVDVNAYTGIGRVSNTVDLLHTGDYLQMRRQAFANDNVEPTNSNGYDLLLWDSTRSVDWQKELMGGTSSISDVQVSMSGGDENINFSIGGGYHRETTVFPGNNSDQRISFHSRIGNKLFNERVATSFSINYSSNFANLPGEDLTTKALNLPPNAPSPYTDEGKLNWEGWVIDNPMAALERPYEARIKNILGNGTVALTIARNVRLNINLGYTNTVNEAVTITPARTLNPATTNRLNQSSFSRSTFQNWISEPQLTWQKSFGLHELDILGGTTFMEQVNEGLAQNASGFSSEALMKNLASAPTILSATNYYSKYRYHALFGRLNYKYNGKYILNVTGRRDGSSRFGPGNQFANFYAVGTAWLFSREEVFQRMHKFLSFGKIRGSFGTSGNDQIGDYRFLDGYASSGSYQNLIGLSPMRLFNANFAWEKTIKFEGGIELGFLQDRLFLSGSYYRNKSSNQLLNLPLPATTGFSSIQGNFPAEIQNEGIELEFRASIIEREKLKWNMSANFTWPDTRLISFNNINDLPEYEALYEVGHPLTIRKLYFYEGVNINSGLHEVSDLNGDGTYSIADRQSIHFLGSRAFGGFQTNLTYRRFTLDLLIQVIRQQGFDHRRLFSFAPGLPFNQPSYVVAEATPPSEFPVQRYGTRGEALTSYSRFQDSDALIADISFTRLKNISLRYSLPNKVAGKIRADDLLLFVQGQNLFTLTKYRGLDPETLTNSLPPLQSITAGFQIKF